MHVPVFTLAGGEDIADETLFGYKQRQKQRHSDIKHTRLRNEDEATMQHLPRKRPLRQLLVRLQARPLVQHGLVDIRGGRFLNQGRQ